MVPFLILLFLCQRMSAAKDQEILKVEPGQDATLTCQSPDKSKKLIGVEWSRSDLSEEEYVLLYRDDHFHPVNQHPSFKNRVDLQDRQMKHGDMSLILKNVTTADSGTYECYALTSGRNRSKRAAETISVIYLSVDPPGQPGESVGLVIGLSVFAVLIVAVGVFFIYKKTKSQGPYHLPAELQSV